MSDPRLASLASRTVAFRLRDANGAFHAYEVLQHRASEGMPLMLEIAALAAGPLAGLMAVVPTLLDSVRGANLRGVMDDPAVLAKVADGLRGADLASLGRGLQVALASPGNAALVMRILSQTTRDSVALDNSIAFDDAFTANYIELARAVWEVILVNRFLSLPATT